MIGFGNGFVNWAEQSVPSGLAAVVIATAPFFMAGVEAFHSDGERLSRRALLGLVLGFIGILVLVWPDLHFDDRRGSLRARRARASGRVPGVGDWIVVFEAASARRIRDRRHGRADDFRRPDHAASSERSAASGVACRFHGRGVAALAYLTVAGSIAGFVSYIYALQYLPVSTVSIYAYINPLIAVILGALLLDEPFSARTVVAMAIVFVGVALVKQPATKASPVRASRLAEPA